MVSSVILAIPCFERNIRSDLLMDDNAFFCPLYQANYSGKDFQSKGVCLDCISKTFFSPVC